MARKRLTQLIPGLLPLRRKQRIFCFYTKMKFDRNRYAHLQTAQPLPFELFASECPMRNYSTGFDMIYQENKVYNLKLAAKKLDGLLLAPGETFSFWNRVRDADKLTPYKDGLVEIDGRLKTQYGGGLCQISNLLCWLFLHTPLTITERHGHAQKDFPEPPSDAPMGVDATISEGWLDFKVRNDTEQTFRLSIGFDDSHIIGHISCEENLGNVWKVVNRNLYYYAEPSGIFEEVEVLQQVYRRADNTLLSEAVAYRNRCKIGYSLPAGTVITERNTI